MMIPPIVGTLLKCNLRASPGSSTRCFNFATLISDGVANRTTKNAVSAPRTICAELVMSDIVIKV